MDASSPRAPALPIAEVERETGLPRATLRIWERRYGFPRPERDARDERLYLPDQVRVLKLMRELVEQGHRPGKLARAGAPEIERLALESASRAMAAAAGGRTRLATRMLKLLHAHDAAALRHELEALLAKNGLAEFAGSQLPQINRMIGQAWLAGELQVHEEHLYSDCVTQVLRVAIAGLQARARPEAPLVMLTTFPQEPHGLGLLMAEAMFALQGCPTVSLGVRLPIEQIVSGARAYRADLVGLTFTASLNPGLVLRGLEELRGMLPSRIRLWAGGNNPALTRRSIAGVRVVDDVRQVPALLAEDFALPPRD
ncbi:MerR family transcriptional regulator [Ramlibacter sp.]|uniref:MerR family transcriptional regulator n=1 Tax=Ramlibacter sp. TaxID=1917967 RepID=UPI001D11C3FE|nr:MerR family transcriptional regulator [Ramlibacter sp.]